jgi:hypothetical protein
MQSTGLACRTPAQVDAGQDEKMLEPVSGLGNGDISGRLATEQLASSPTTHYVMEGINDRFAQLAHLDTALSLLKQAGQLEVAAEQMHQEGEVRCYQALTKAGCGILIRIDGTRARAELIVGPADHDLEESLLICLYGLFGLVDTVVEKHRVRNATLLRVY